MAPTRQTILQIIPQLDTGGAELSTIEIAAAVTQAGGRALVLSQGGRMEDRLAAAGGELIRFSAATKNPARIIWNASRIAALIAKESVDIIHARSRAPAWSALMAARRAGIPFVTTYHGAYNEEGRLKKLYNSVMVRSDRVIANSGYTRDLIISRYGTPAEKVRVVYRGVDCVAYDPAAIDSSRTDALRKAWHVPANAPIILQPARLTSWKGQEVLIAAADKLEREGRLGEAHIVLAGDAQGRSGYEALLMSQVATAGLEDRVHIVGHVDDMPAAYACALVTVVASVEPEAFGRTAAEAQAMGCPVIATAIGAPQETVMAAPRVGLDERTGWLVPPGDAGAMAEALGECLAFTPDQRDTMGQRARSHVLTSFTLEAMKQQTMAVYDELSVKR